MSCTPVSGEIGRGEIGRKSKIEDRRSRMKTEDRP
jgi:hypothetical protein